MAMGNLGNYTLTGALLLVADTLLLIWSAGVFIRFLKLPETNPRLQFIVHYLGITTLIFVSSLILSAGGLLSARGFIGLHGLLAVFALIMVPMLAPLGERQPQPVRDSTTAPPRSMVVITRSAIAILIVVGIVVFLQAILAEPLNYDSNTYRLTRIGYWLQEGSIEPIFSNDARSNFVPYLPDTLMLWITSFFPIGYPAVNVIQAVSGLVLAVTMWEFGSALGFTPIVRAATIALTFGMPNLGLELFTSQTDLIVTAFAIAGLLFIRYACLGRLSTHWFWSGLSFGSAIAAKGTVFFWGPGLAVVMTIWLLVRRYSWRDAVKGLAVFAIPFLAIGSIPYLRNLGLYGHPLGPTEEIAAVEATPSLSRVDFASMNLTAYCWQIFEPNSNPLLPSLVTSPPFSYLAQRIEDWTDPPSPNFETVFEIARRSYHYHVPNEDVASTGLLPVLLGLAASIALILNRRPSDRICRRDLLLVAASGVAFFLLFAALQTWTPHKFRYFVLISPLVTLLTGSLIERFPVRVWRPCLACILFAAGITSFCFLSVRSLHHGWLTILNSSRSPHSALTASMRDLIRSLPETPLTVGLAVRENTWLASFFRVKPNIKFEFITNDSFLGLSPEESLKKSAVDLLITNSDSTPHLPSSWPRIGNDSFTLFAAPETLTFPESITREGGFYGDSWTETVFSWHLSNLEKDFGTILQAANPAPFERTVITRLDGVPLDEEKVPAHSSLAFRLNIPAGTHLLTTEVIPAFIPADYSVNSDTRHLGLKNAVLVREAPQSGAP